MVPDRQKVWTDGMGINARKPQSSGICKQLRRTPDCTSAPLFFAKFESIISKLSSSQISFLYLVSVAEQVGFSLT